MRENLTPKEIGKNINKAQDIAKSSIGHTAGVQEGKQLPCSGVTHDQMEAFHHNLHKVAKIMDD